MSTKYALLSLPLGVFDSSDREEAISSLRGTISSDNGSVLPFSIPDFKIGTLDALVQQADDLAKLEASCQAVVAKVGDSLKNVLEGDEDRIAQYKMVNDSKMRPCLFRWPIANSCWQSPLISISVLLAGIGSDTELTSPWASSSAPSRRQACTRYYLALNSLTDTLRSLRPLTTT